MTNETILIIRWVSIAYFAIGISVGFLLLLMVRLFEKMAAGEMPDSRNEGTAEMERWVESVGKREAFARCVLLWPYGVYVLIRFLF